MSTERNTSVYDFSYEFAFYFTKRKPTVNRVLLSLSLLPPPLPLQLSFSLISTFFCRSSVVSIDSPTTQERSRNSLKIILRNDNRILHASKKKRQLWNTYVLIRAAVLLHSQKTRVSFSFRIIYSLTL